MEEEKAETVKSWSDKETIERTNKSVQYFFIISAFSSFLYASRTTIWIQYANEFQDSSKNMISYILLTDSIFIAIAGILFCSLGDCIGFDKSITFKLLLICIGCILESIATDFKILCIGFLISQTATLYVAMGYIAWILPVKNAKIQTNLLYAAASIAYLIGPLFSGILYKLFREYRYIFIINTILMILLLIFSVIFVYGNQKSLEQLQIASSMV
eukprot:117226_1